MVEAEKELLKQLGDDSYQPLWHKIPMVPRSTASFDYNFDEPPPYDYPDSEMPN